MQIPVSEAFQENERTDVSIALDPDQIRWLKDQSAKHGVSPDQIVRYLINSHAREGDDLPTGFHDAIDEDEAEPSSDSSVLDELRDASSMLDDLTSDETSSSDAESTRAVSSEPASDENSSSTKSATSLNTPTSPESSTSSSPSGPEPTSPSESLPESAADRSRPAPPSSPKATPKDFVPDELTDDDGDASSSDEEDADDAPSSMFEMVDDE